MAVENETTVADMTDMAGGLINRGSCHIFSVLPASPYDALWLIAQRRRLNSSAPAQRQLRSLHDFRYTYGAYRWPTQRPVREHEISVPIACTCSRVGSKTAISSAKTVPRMYTGCSGEACRGTPNIRLTVSDISGTCYHGEG